MKLSRFAFGALLAAGMMIGQAYAGGGKCASRCGKSKAAGQAVASAGCSAVKAVKGGEGCKKGVICEKGPDCCQALATQLTYRVGTLETPCAETAAEAAKKNGGKIEYLVGGKGFQTEDEAKVALTAKIEAALADMLVVRFAVGDKCVPCPMTAEKMAKEADQPIKYRAVGREFQTREAAEAALAKAKAAVEAVAGAGVSKDKSTCDSAGKSQGSVAAKNTCRKTATVAAKSHGSCKSKGGAQAVAGKECDPTACPESCKIDCRLAGARAKYHAALSSVESGDKVAAL